MFPAIASLLGGLTGSAGSLAGLAGGMGGVAGRSVSLLGNLGKTFSAVKPLPFNKPPPVPNATPWQKQIEASERAAHAIKEQANVENQLADKAFAAGRALDQISEIFKGLPGLIVKPLEMVKQFGDAIGQFSSLSNPGQAAVFGRTMTDAFAALGKGLEPLMGFAIRLGQFVGDVFAKYEPVISAISQGLANVGDMFLKIFGGIFNDVFTALTPMLEVFVDVIGTLMPIFAIVQPVLIVLVGVMQLFALELRAVTYPLRLVIGFLQSLGIMSKKINPDATSKGMAAQNFSISTSADDFQRQMATAALSSNGPATPDQAIVQMPGILDDIKNEIKDLVNKLPAMLNDTAVKFGMSIGESLVKNNPVSKGYEAGQDLVGYLRNLAMR